MLITTVFITLAVRRWKASNSKHFQNQIKLWTVCCAAHTYGICFHRRVREMLHLSNRRIKSYSKSSDCCLGMQFDPLWTMTASTSRWFNRICGTVSLTCFALRLERQDVFSFLSWVCGWSGGSSGEPAVGLSRLPEGQDQDRMRVISLERVGRAPVEDIQ